MKCLILTQPWATAVALGLKQWETRSWSTSYRGLIAIHAAKGFPGWAKDFAQVEATLGRIPHRLPLGCIIALADLMDIRPIIEVELEIGAIEQLYGDYSPGRFAWKLENVRVLREPIACKGALGLWFPSQSIREAIEAQLMDLRL